MIRSASRISSGQVGQAGLPVMKGSMKTVLEPLILTAEWPSQVISILRSFAARSGLLFQSLDGSAEALEFILDPLAATVEGLRVRDAGVVPAGQAGAENRGRA